MIVTYHVESRLKHGGGWVQAFSRGTIAWARTCYANHRIWNGKTHETRIVGEVVANGDSYAFIVRQAGRPGFSGRMSENSKSAHLEVGDD